MPQKDVHSKKRKAIPQKKLKQTYLNLQTQNSRTNAHNSRRKQQREENTDNNTLLKTELEDKDGETNRHEARKKRTATRKQQDRETDQGYSTDSENSTTQKTDAPKQKPLVYKSLQIRQMIGPNMIDNKLQPATGTRPAMIQQRLLHCTENIPFGNTINKDSDEDSELLLFHNINGLKDDKNWYQILTTMSELGVDIMGFAEINKSIQLGYRTDQWKSTIRKIYYYS
jgi:hypothetical protein